MLTSTLTPDNEAERLRALWEYEILDTPAEEAFDDIVRVAAHICGTPVSVISLVDEARQWYKARIGVDTQETPRDISFCTHTILQSDVMEIPDSHLDPRFAASPLVVGDPHVRFYAGAPLVAPGGVHLGALCVIDRSPRMLEAEQREMLQALARQVITQLESRRHIVRLEQMIDERQRTVRRLAVQFATSWVLSLSDTLEEAAPLLLREICAALGWKLGALWRIEPDASQISCIAVWNEPSHPAPRLAAVTRNRQFDLGEGIPGKTWAQGTPVWIPDVSQEPGIRISEAARDGLHGVFAVPVDMQGTVLAVLELWSSAVEPRDADLLETMITIGHQIGQFIERAHAQAALRASQARARAIVDSSLAGIFTYDESGIIESVNPAAEEIFGFSRAELVGTNLTLLLPESLEARPGQTVGVETEGRGRRKNGETFPFELAVSEFHTPSGRRFAGSIRDISERQEVERLKREFVSTVSHELRTPLTSIRGSLGLLAAGALGEIPEEAKDVIGIAQRNCLHLIALINDMLDLDRLQNGSMEMSFGQVPLSAVVRRSLDAVKGFAEAQGVILASRGEAGVLWGDEDRLVQVLVNLLSNAVKFSPRGGVVDVTVSTGEDYEEVSVEDHGRGIPARFHQAIFERFQQVEASDAREKGGTGLGLSICKAIVSLHRGSIGVESEEGKGSTFWVRVPTRPLGKTRAADEGFAENPPTPGKLPQMEVSP